MGEFNAKVNNTKTKDEINRQVGMYQTQKLSLLRVPLQAKSKHAHENLLFDDDNLDPGNFFKYLSLPDT